MSEPFAVVALIDRFIDAWKREDLDAVTACLADDVVYCDTGRKGVANTYRGREQVSQAFAGNLGDDSALTLGPVIAVDDRAISEWEWKNAEDGTTLRGVDVYTVRDGKITAKDVFGKLV